MLSERGKMNRWHTRTAFYPIPRRRTQNPKPAHLSPLPHLNFIKKWTSGLKWTGLRLCVLKAASSMPGQRSFFETKKRRERSRRSLWSRHSWQSYLLSASPQQSLDHLSASVARAGFLRVQRVPRFRVHEEMAAHPAFRLAALPRIILLLSAH